MTPEEFKRNMQAVFDKYQGEKYCEDEETRHRDADELLMQALRELGYTEGVEIFDSMGKWYA